MAELPPIVIQTEKGDLVGFILLANLSAPAGGNQSGDCIFSITPKESRLWDLDLVKQLQAYGPRESGEFQFRMTVSQATRILAINGRAKGKADLLLEIPENGAGEVLELTKDGKRKRLAVAFFLPRR